MKKQIFQKVLFAVCLCVINVVNANQIIIPENAWLVNNFRQKDSGAKLSFEKAPDNSNALMLDFFGPKHSNISIKPEVIKNLAEKWPETFNGFKGYFWNDGKLTKLAFAFRIDYKNQFVGFIKMDHKGWKMLKINQVVNFRNKAMKLKPNQIFSIFFNCSNRENFKMGLAALNWEEKGTELYREPVGNTANIIKALKPPEIDGVLNDAVWLSVKPAWLENQVISKEGKIRNKSWIKAVWDEDNFYIAASMQFPEGTKLKTDMKNHDDPLWENDDFEFMLYPGCDQRKFYQFLVNPANTKTELARIFDQVADRIKVKYKDWNGEWTVKTKILLDRWTVEAAVPWKTVGAEKVPEIIQFQALRTDKSMKRPQYSAWSPVRRAPTEGFGFLNPVENNRTSVFFNDITLMRLDNGKIAVNGTAQPGNLNLKVWYNSPYSPSETFTMRLKSDAPVKTFNWILPVKTLVNGYHQLLIKGTADDSSSGCALFNFNQTLPNKVAFSDIILNPVPKKMKLLKGVFTPEKNDVIGIPPNASERTKKTALMLAEKIYGIYGIKLPVKRGVKSRILLNITAPGHYTAAGPASEEAYKLKISPGKILIDGNGEAGLYYGVVTLTQLAAAPKLPNMPVKCVDISDYPTFENRIVCLYEMGHCKKAVNGRGYSVQKIKDWIKRYVAGSKYNILSWGFADNVNYPSLRELHHPDNFTPEDIHEIFAFARENFVQDCAGNVIRSAFFVLDKALSGEL